MHAPVHLQGAVPIEPPKMLCDPPQIPSPDASAADSATSSPARLWVLDLDPASFAAQVESKGISADKPVLVRRGEDGGGKTECDTQFEANNAHEPVPVDETDRGEPPNLAEGETGDGAAQQETTGRHEKRLKDPRAQAAGGCLAPRSRTSKKITASRRSSRAHKRVKRQEAAKQTNHQQRGQTGPRECLIWECVECVTICVERGHVRMHLPR